MTKNERARADVSALLRARNTLIWIQTREEARVESVLFEVDAKAGYRTLRWDCKAGLVEERGASYGGGRQLADPNAILDYVESYRERAVFVLRDMHLWLDPVIKRGLRNLARSLQSSPRGEARAIVVLSPSGEIPPELAGHATLIDWPLPERAEIGAILDDVVRALPEELASAAPVDGARDAAIDAAIGLLGEEAGSCYAKSLVTTRTLDPAVVSGEKRRVIEREKVLTWYEPDPRGLDAVGGGDLLKSWLASRRSAFTQRARDFGLLPPKGMMLVGPPGCGKSLTWKAVAAAWRMPLLVMDVGALRSKYVGESEGNIRRALQTAEAVAPCVLVLDEIEKSMAGASGPQGDGGVAADALGAILTWMQEHEGAVFVIATANDVRALPPELMRKGRFDEVWFVDLPTRADRAAIVQTTLAKYGRTVDALPYLIEEDALTDIVRATEGFTGAEIAAVVSEAMFAAFGDGERAPTTTDMCSAAKSIVPLSKSAAEKIENLRSWAKVNARPAGSPEVAPTTDGARKLDL